MRNKHFRSLSLILFLAFTVSCSRGDISYESIYDPIADEGQYTFPSLSGLPSGYVTLRASSLKDCNLAASISGLGARAIEEGRSDTGFWIACGHDAFPTYQKVLEGLEAKGCRGLGEVDALELALSGKMMTGGREVDLDKICDGYILTDISRNPESPAVATTASHIFRGIIVDRQDRDAFDQAGYRMLYDASDKTVPQAYDEFFGRCARNGFAVMPSNTWENKDFAIQNGWFFMDMYPLPGDQESGDRWDIFEKCCSAMEPNSSVFGWEWSVRHDERDINGMISRYGLNTAVNDWAYNYPLANAAYRTHQKADLARVLDPKDIDYSKVTVPSKTKRLVSFFLTDGDNTQWMMGGFLGNYLLHPDARATKMAFGINTTLTPQISPEAYGTILASQPDGCTLVEVQGGGVIYSDTFGETVGREEALKKRAAITASWMRQHRIKVLGLMAKEYAGSPEAQECYKAMIEANDQLVGIIAVQYTPYAGDEGRIYWFTNSAGCDIPVVTVKYSIWNTNPPYRNVEGSPAFVARRLREDSHNSDFNLVAVHAWSRFTDAGPDCDEVAELSEEGGIYGAGAARLCASHLDDSFEVVSLEELLWQLRMRERPIQTRNFLKGLK